MTLSTQPYKGARDFYPEDKRLQKYIFGVMRRVAERYGYEEYDAPVLEPLELYLAKSGEEIVNEQTYAFEDRGGRQVTIRPEMTPTVSRMVAAKRQELAYPLRWYSIPNLWRYERPQRGRLREHWQLNVDIFGDETLAAEQELVMLANDTMREFGAKSDSFTIRLNSRKLMDTIFAEYIGLDETQAHTVSKIIDRMNKMSPAEFSAQIDAVFTPSQRESGTSTKLLELLQIKDAAKLPAELMTHPATQEIQTLIQNLHDVNITHATLDLSLMRGFDYYTGVVFEIFDNHPDNNRALFGGGRYDGLVGLFGVEPIATVGFGVGDVGITNFLETHELLPELRPETDVYVVLIGDVLAGSQKLIQALREMSVNVAVDNSGRKMDKQIKTAVKKGIRYALFVGAHELESERYNLKDLQTGQEEAHGVERLVSIIKDYRTNNS